MSNNTMTTTYEVPLRRRREQKTDYRQKYKLLLSGKPRLVIRRSNTRFIVHMVAYGTHDTTSHYTDSFALREYGWTNNTGNIPAAYLTGYLCGMKIQQDAPEVELVPDIGRFKPEKGSSIFVVMKGLADSGALENVSDEVFPTDDRIRGEHIAAYAEQAEGAQFAAVQKSAQNITNEFEQVKQQIETTHGE